MKTTLSLIFVIMLLAGTGFTQETIRIPANFDDEGNCTDLVVGYGQFLEPTDGFWVFTVQGDTTTLNGLPFDPLRTLREQWSPPKDINPLISAKHNLSEEALAVYRRGGLHAAAEFYQESNLVESVTLNETENWLFVTFSDGASTEVMYLTAEQEEARKNRGPQPTRLDRFRELIEIGQGFVFGTDTSVNIPVFRKQAFAQALRKVHKEELLTTTERAELPLFKRGFRRDVNLN